MDISQRTVRLAGIAMILAAILTVITVGLTASGTSDKSPFEEDEAGEYLTDIHDNADLIQAAGAVGIVNDGVFLVLTGAAFFILFRDRNPFLATVTLLGVGMAATLSLIVDASNILQTMFAEDYVEGLGEGIPAGDSASLQLGRYVGIITYLFVNLLFTPVATAFLALGALLVGAPQGRINPPKWIGWVSVVAGASAGLSWLVVAADPFFVFFPIQLISTLVLLLSLGLWLMRHDDLQPAPMNA